MHVMTIVHCFALLVGLSSAQTFNPYMEGPHSVTSVKKYMRFGFMNYIDVYLPTEAGSYPVIYYLGGWKSILPAYYYSDVLRHIASHGYVVATVRNPWIWESWETKATNLKKSISQLKSSYSNFRRWPEGVNINFDYSFGMGYSWGARSMVEYLGMEACEELKALVLISPVDSFMGELYFQGDEQLNVQIPTLVLAAGYEGVEAGQEIEGAVCFSDDEINYHFYNAIPGNYKWIITSNEYDHNDWINELYKTIVDIFPNACLGDDQPDPTRDRDIYRDFIAGQVVAMYEGVMAGNGTCQTYFDFLETIAATSPVTDLTIEYVHTSGDCPTEPLCTVN